LAGDKLRRCQAAWNEWEAPAKEQWLEARRHCRGMARHSFKEAEGGQPVVARKWFGITGLTYGSVNAGDVNPVARPFLELDPCFLDLVDCPGPWEVAERVLCGPDPADPDPRPRGGIRCTGVGPRTYPSDADGEGYTYWHRDSGVPSQPLYPAARVIKAFIYLSDVEEDAGPLGVVPGSHKLASGPWETTRRGFRSSMTLDAEMPQAAMPNCVSFTGKAGTALLFDTACWHTAMPNTSGKDRRCVIMGWAMASGGGMLSPEYAAELQSNGRMTPVLQKLTGN
jgi:hypothetical protein